MIPGGKKDGVGKAGNVMGGTPIPDPSGQNPEKQPNPVQQPVATGKPKKKQCLVYLPDGLSTALKRYCEDSGMSKSSVVCSALYDYLKRYQNNVIGN